MFFIQPFQSVASFITFFCRMRGIGTYGLRRYRLRLCLTSCRMQLLASLAFAGRLHATKFVPFSKIQSGRRCTSLEADKQPNGSSKFNPGSNVCNTSARHLSLRKGEPHAMHSQVQYRSSNHHVFTESCKWSVPIFRCSNCIPWTQHVLCHIGA
jgi:hypothetical protein